jgi:23S rRNA (guanosine2251-2'-O)-methyltransferase
LRKIQNAELQRLTVDDFKQSPKNAFVIVLDGVRSMNNIGSIFRTADAFRCEKIFLCGITATPPHREIHKTSLGSENSVTWEYEKRTEDALIRLRAENYIIAAVEQIENGILLDKFIPDKNKKYAFVFGHEITGVSDKALSHCDIAIEIPQYGTKHSLNVAVSAGVIAWHFIMKNEK